MESEEHFDKTTKNLLQNIASENGLVCYEIRKNHRSVKGDGYLGLVTGVELVCKDREDREKKLNVVVKSASKNDALRAQILLNDMYTREVYMYNVVFRAFKQFETDKNLKPTTVAAKFYKADLEHKNEVLVLENLKEGGYKMYSRTKTMDAEHVSMVLEKYAQLHALSFALRDQNLEKFKQISSMNELYVKHLEYSNFKKTLKDLALKSLKSLRKDVDTEAYKIYKDCINDIDKILAVSDDYAAVIHGDCWTNNMMFKYDDSQEPNKPISVRFVDFQVSRMGPPVLDVAYFFYTCSAKELIDNLEKYLGIYYNKLASHLRKLGSNPDKIYPYSIFWEQWKKYARFGLIYAMTLIYIMLTEENESVNLEDVAEADKSVADAFNFEIANSDLYYDRVRHIILHFVENKFI